MPNNRSNLYSLPSDAMTSRVMQDLVDRINFLTQEIESIRGAIPSGMARKENPQPGIITIPSRHDGGQDGLIRVNPDGVIASYVNPAESFFPYIDTASVTNITTGLDPLQSVIIPAGSLVAEGDCLEVHYAGNYASNDNNKRVVFSVDGNIHEDTGLIDVDALGWNIYGRLTRISPTSLQVVTVIDLGILQIDSAGGVSVTAIGGRMNQRAANRTVGNMNTTTFTLSLQGEGTATGDVSQFLSYIDLKRPRTRKLV